MKHPVCQWGKTSGVARISSRRGPNFMGAARYPTYPVTSLVTLRSLKVFPRQFLKVYQIPLELCLLCALFFCFCITLARTSFFTKREHTWGGAPPCHLAPGCDRASRQRPADSLGRSESNGVRVDLFRSTIDLPDQIKKQCSVFRVSFFSR